MAATGDCFSRGGVHTESTAILFFWANAQSLVFAGIVFAEECGPPLIEFVQFSSPQI